jgi:hypothetical protein
MEKERVNELAPCGVYCGACPSFNKSCKGCASTDTNQKRRSKWSCKIRNCCYEQRGFTYCAYCDDFPCIIIRKKLLSAHADNPSFKYRFEIPDISVKLRAMEVDEYLSFQRERWKCKSCGGIILFYHYKCNTCGQTRYV